LLPEADAGAKALNCENVEKTIGLPRRAILAVFSLIVGNAGLQRGRELQVGYS
jgi:hypothetical protein